MPFSIAGIVTRMEKVLRGIVRLLFVLDCEAVGLVVVLWAGLVVVVPAGSLLPLCGEGF